MAEKDLKKIAHHPQKREDVWWYEENDGIYVVMEDLGKGYGPNACKITWTSLRAALRRKDKK